MQTPFPLPVECLQQIIQILVAHRAVPALAALLRVNKHVCLATLPLLYSNPFNFFETPEIRHTHYSINSQYPRLHAIVRLLLTSIPTDGPDLLEATYGRNDPQCWPVNYLSYLQHFMSQTHASNSFLIHLSQLKTAAPKLKQYVRDHGLVEKYDALATMVEIERLDKGDDLVSENTLAHLNLEIHRELTWAICNQVFEQLRSIFIPLSDIGRYLDSVPRLSSLASVTFRLDQYADREEFWLESMSDEARAKVRQAQAQRIRDLETAVEFVKRHTLLFKGTLKQVMCPTNYKLGGMIGQSCPPHILRQMHDCLPSLDRITQLVNKNWKQFLAGRERINLEHVTSINVWEHGEPWYADLRAQPFLHRCTALKFYNMVSMGPDSFKWAVQKDASVIPPMERIVIRAVQEPIGSELDDIAEAFSGTLQTWFIEGYGQQRFGVPALGDPAHSRIVKVGHGWKMPVLYWLSVKMVSERLIVDPSLMSHCSSLKSLMLTDWLRAYDLREIQPVQPEFAPDLKQLYLAGTPALSFHPDTLHSTKELATLVLGSPSAIDRVFAPSVHAFSQEDPFTTEEEEATKISRPEWTWDWHLPNLVTLHLSIEFSIPFQFFMLQGTPSLQDMSLTIFSTQERVERVLTEADFEVMPLTSTSAAESDPEETSEQPEAEPATMEDIVQELIEEARSPRSMNVAAEIATYLFRVQSQLERQRGEVLEQQDRPQRQLGENMWPQDVPDRPIVRSAEDDERLVFNRERHLDIRRDDIESKFCEKTEASSRRASEGGAAELKKMIRNFDEFLGRDPVLRTYFKKALVDWRQWKRKQVVDTETAKRTMAVHPGRLAVPSLRSLELNGHWVMSDQVLEIMLGQVFRNLGKVDEFKCEGFSTEAWIRITQGMPFLREANSSRQLDQVEVGADYMMREHQFEKQVSPFECDTRSRLVYGFSNHGGRHYMVA
ncbi:hypothetical protein CPB97_009519 [Podila verticillata]|nr:hypothetical protein CPB97_009519 [Podila verticillata]